jgi:hypothetical protein
MRFVTTKTLEQQSCLMLHHTRHLSIRQQTAVINAIRAHLAEFGIVAPVGRVTASIFPIFSSSIESCSILARRNEDAGSAQTCRLQ